MPVKRLLSIISEGGWRGLVWRCLVYNHSVRICKFYQCLSSWLFFLDKHEQRRSRLLSKALNHKYQACTNVCRKSDGKWVPFMQIILLVSSIHWNIFFFFTQKLPATNNHHLLCALGLVTLVTLLLTLLPTLICSIKMQAHPSASTITLFLQNFLTTLLFVLLLTFCTAVSRTHLQCRKQQQPQSLQMCGSWQHLSPKVDIQSPQPARSITNISNKRQIILQLSNIISN